MLRCPVCDLDKMRVVETRGDYRRRKCQNCGHAFFTFKEEVCTRQEYYLHEQMCRKEYSDKVAAGAVSPLRRKRMTHLTDTHKLELPRPFPVKPAKEVLQPVRLLSTGHYVEEPVPGVRTYRMKV